MISERSKRTRFIGRIAVAAAAVSAVALYLFVGMSVWRSAEISGHVVDSQTGKPLQGAIVIANWQLSGLEGYPVGQLTLLEVTTDGSGRFSVPAWGPRWYRGGGIVRGDQPIVRIFARGYVPLVANNLTPGVAQDLARAPSRMQSRLNGQTMRLTAHRGSLADYSRVLIPLRHSLDFAFEGTHCEWKQAPLIFVEFDRIRRELQKSGIDSELPLLEHLGGQEQCRNALEYFKELERR